MIRQIKMGDKLVLMPHGVVEVKKIIETPSGRLSYTLKSIDGSMTFISPPGAMDVRSLSSAEEIGEVFQVLRQKEHKSLLNLTWNKRYREYSEKLSHQDGLKDVVEVLRDLWTIRSVKDLSFGERKMVDKAMRLLVEEISIVTGSSSQETENKIRGVLDGH